MVAEVPARVIDEKELSGVESEAIEFLNKLTSDVQEDENIAVDLPKSLTVLDHVLKLIKNQIQSLTGNNETLKVVLCVQDAVFKALWQQEIDRNNDMVSVLRDNQEIEDKFTFIIESLEDVSDKELFERFGTLIRENFKVEGIRILLSPEQLAEWKDFIPTDVFEKLSEDGQLKSDLQYNDIDFAIYDPTELEEISKKRIYTYSDKNNPVFKKLSTQEATQCLAAIPLLKSKQEPVSGVVALGKLSRYGYMDDMATDLLETLMHNLSQLIELRRLRGQNAQLEELSGTDSLTGLANRGAFDRGLSEMINEVENPKLALLCFDLDHFKNINDTYGHPIGDVVLKQVAHILQTNTRDDQLVARLGGEELGIILSDVDEEAARRVAERIREAIELFEFKDQKGETFHVTTSVGVYPRTQGDTPEMVIGNADVALYNAKKWGRNKVVFYGEKRINTLVHFLETIKSRLGQILGSSGQSDSY